MRVRTAHLIIHALDTGHVILEGESGGVLVR